MAEKDENIKLDEAEIERLIEEIKNNSLSEESRDVLLKTLSTFNDICTTLQQKRATITNLRNLLGIKTEKDSGPRRGVSSSDTDDDQKKTLDEEERKQIQKMLVKSWIQSQK